MRYYQNWQARVLKGNDLTDYFPATVPGNVQRDYAAYKGILDDIQFSNNVEKLEETENYTWEYRALLNFNYDTSDSVYFVAEGIDYKYDILLNDELIYSYEGLYQKAELDITKKIKENSEIKVIIYPHPKMKGSFVRTRDEAADSFKPPVCYGWDWNPRLLISGFWGDAFIETRKFDYINNFEPTYTLNLENLTANVNFLFSCNATPVIELKDPLGNVVYTGTDKNFTINNVQLWWCNGKGQQNLYSYTVKTKSDTKSGKIGFRTVRLVNNPLLPEGFPKGQDDSPFTLELNGQKIFLKGSNYVNPEIFNANTSPKTNKFLVSAAKEANMNILRLWGGAGPAKPEFYDYCDEYGILVWQEFPLACNNYPNNRHYLSVLKKEASAIIKKIRPHACLALWCGGNELFNGWSGMTDQSLPLRLLNKLCYELDAFTPFIYTSPRSGMAHGGYSFSDGGGKEVYKIFQNASNTAYTEFGVPGFSPISQLKKIIPKEELFPITPTKSYICHHAFLAWGDTSWARLDTLERYFGKLESLEQIVEHSEWLQCEGYKAIFEESRRQWPRCSAALNWCYNEPWITAAGNSIISYPNIKKPAYYAIKNSLQPCLATARISKFLWNENENIKIELWYHNDSLNDVEDTINAVINIGDTQYDLLTWNTGVITKNSNKMGPAINFTLPRVINANKFTIHLYTLNKFSQNQYTLCYKSKEVTAATIRKTNA